jgi:hypothetical protein
VIVLERVGGNGEELGDVVRDGVAERAHRGVVAASLARQGAVARRVDCLQVGICGFGLGGALGGLDPEDLQVGERRAELLLRERLALVELPYDREDLVVQPALLGVGTEEQTDVGEGSGVGLGGHGWRPWAVAREVGLFPDSTGSSVGFRTSAEFPRFSGQSARVGARAQAEGADLR